MADERNLVIVFSLLLLISMALSFITCFSLQLDKGLTKLVGSLSFVLLLRVDQ